MMLSNRIVKLRAPEKDDLDFMYLLENDEGMAENSFATAPVSRQALWNFIENSRGDIFSDRQLRLVIIECSTGSPVGLVDLSDFEPRDRRAFIGIAVTPENRRRGIATAALSLVCDYAASTLGLHQLAVQIAADNIVSRRLFEKCGFKTCGCMRSWIRRGPHYFDAYILQRLFAR